MDRRGFLTTLPLLAVSGCSEFGAADEQTEMVMDAGSTAFSVAVRGDYDVTVESSCLDGETVRLGEGESVSVRRSEAGEQCRYRVGVDGVLEVEETALGYEERAVTVHPDGTVERETVAEV